MSDLLPCLSFEDALPDAPFSELHSRVVSRPIAQVWPSCLEVTAADISALGPLMALRSLPATLSGRKRPQISQPKSLLEVFANEGFVLLRRDDEPVDGAAVVIFGAAGRFWSATNNTPRRFESPADFTAFDEPDHAMTVTRLEAFDLGDGTTRIETETRVVGTDRASTKKFGRYWLLIRLPSGLIRRSWLAAIDRRATR